MSAVDVYEVRIGGRFTPLSPDDVVLGGGGGYGLVASLQHEPFAVVDDPEVQVELGASREGVEDALADPHHDVAGYPVLTRPYLALLKLRAGRTQDLADVQRLLAGTPRAERASTRRLIEHHAPEIAEDYDSLITLADLEFGPPPEG